MSHKVLLVDDNEDLLLITQIILKGQGLHVLTARTREEAEHKIRIHHPDLLLLDLHLDNDNGNEFCKQLKTNPFNYDLRVILMSGDEFSTIQGFSADDFLSKPFDFDDLLEKVQRQLITENVGV